MKNQHFILLWLIFVLLTCKEETAQQSVLPTEEKPKIEEKYVFIDSIIKIKKEEIRKHTEKGIGTATAVYNQAHDGSIGFNIQYPDGTTEYRSNLGPKNDYSWFTNETLKETLALQFSNDGNRLGCAFHFKNELISSDMIHEMNSIQNTLKGLVENDSITKFYIKQIIETAPQLNQNYFITNSNIKIGDKTKKVYNLYGKPEEQSTTIDGYQKLKWLNDSPKQEISIYSKNEVIIGIIIHNIKVDNN